MLQVRNISRRFGGVQALTRVSFEAQLGEVLGLVGPNGAGKSTLVNCITGFLSPDAGRVFWDGADCTAMPAHKLCRAGLTRTFQHTRLFPELSVQENVEIGADVHTKAGLLRSCVHARQVGKDDREVERAARDALEAVGWTGPLDEPAKNVSTGNQRLVALARALASHPRMLLIDEPAAGLTDAETAALARHLRRLADDGYGLVVIDHDVHFIFDISSRVIVLAEGALIAEGTPSAVRADPRVIDAYPGECGVTLVGRRIKVAYAGAVAVDEVDVEVPPGEVTCVFGPNGAGKSSLLRALAGLVKVQSGDIEFDGRKITSMPAPKRVSLGVALVPEGRALFPDMSVETNLLLGGYKLSPRARRSAIESAYDLFPRIAGRRKQLASTLSGGEQQMVAVARGLIAGPKVLMVDEPSLGLAPMIVIEIFEHLRKIADGGLAVLLVEQNTRRALEIADHALVLHRGRVDLSGSAAELRESEWAQAGYLGPQEDRRHA